jgi:SAM-dependent methyltransferase
MTLDYEAVLTRNRAVWSAGDWDKMSQVIAAVGPRLLDTIGVGPGTRLLDIGTGSGGTVAIPAAQRGADVVGSDFIDTWFDAARRRASEAGVEVEWVVADAQDLPFEDASFDVVTSTFGHMFAPNQEAAAAELARVVKPGGTIGFAAWRPMGNIGRFFAAVGSHMPPPPEGFKPPPLWGTEDRVRELLEPHGIELSFSNEVVPFEFADKDDLLELQETSFGPLVTARAVLGDDGWPALRDDLRKLFDDVNERTDGSYSANMEYLQTIGRRPA